MVTNQKREIDSIVESDHIHLLIFAHNNLYYANIKGQLSIFAFKKINEQYQKAVHVTTQEPLSPLRTGTFSKIMGLPCAHKIEYLDNNQGLILNDIHNHWCDSKKLNSITADENNFLHEDALQPLLQNLQREISRMAKFQQVK
ncbi:15996_t:CDS:1 [Funneliformis geosporum]|uniref:7131_t:CDS:1 n=1 Tax=Funneliformis geosporum TaxID=1117311 RepID=A0A9W4WJ03_9GLOM|nr:15996_t:CDS:1 [Funneliformis geosporum]CAI2165380.1 7131_t:CDS:1 [Funneliformis geosporum]